MNNNIKEDKLTLTSLVAIGLSIGVVLIGSALIINSALGFFSISTESITHLFFSLFLCC